MHASIHVYEASLCHVPVVGAEDRIWSMKRPIPLPFGANSTVKGVGERRIQQLLKRTLNGSALDP